MPSCDLIMHHFMGVRHRGAPPPRSCYTPNSSPLVGALIRTHTMTSSTTVQSLKTARRNKKDEAQSTDRCTAKKDTFQVYTAGLLQKTKTRALPTSPRKRYCPCTHHTCQPTQQAPCSSWRVLQLLHISLVHVKAWDVQELHIKHHGRVGGH